MFSTRIYEIWYCVCVVLTSSWSWWFADGSCLYPGHRSNELVQFTASAPNSSYPTGTVAMYHCGHERIQDRFKELICLENGTWKWHSGKLDPPKCDIAVVNRCQHRAAAGNELPLKTLLIDNVCIDLYDGITDPTRVNLTMCNTNPFWSSEALESKSVFYTTNEKLSICNAFGLQKRLMFLMSTKNSDEKWMQDFTEALKSKTVEWKYPHCPYLECSLRGYLFFYKSEHCNINGKHWVCRHAVSSCGIPSQRKNSIMKFSGIYVRDVAEYQCYPGYETIDNLKRECDGNGLWVGEAPTCERKDTIIHVVNCGTPTHNENVTIELTNGSTTFGSWLTYTCKSPEHYMNGSEYRICQADGQWDGMEPTCHWTENEVVTSRQFDLNPGEDDLLKLIIGAIAGVTVFLIALMWLVLAGLLYRDKRKQQSRIR